MGGGKGDRIEVISRGVLLRGSAVLLCRSVAGGYRYLPGGHVEFGEAAGAALARELEEECGLRVRVGSLLLVSEGAFATGKRRHHEVNLVFHVEQDGEPPAAVRSREALIGFDWIDLAAVADMDIRPLAVKAWLISSRAAGAEFVSEVP